LLFLSNCGVVCENVDLDESGWGREMFGM
jgi:hypothetical protein